MRNQSVRRILSVAVVASTLIMWNGVASASTASPLSRVHASIGAERPSVSSPKAVTHLNSGWIEATDAFGDAPYADGPVTYGPDQLPTLFAAEMPSNQGSLVIKYPAGQRFTAGVVYQTSPGSQDSLDAGLGGVECNPSTDSSVSAAFVFDQVTYDPSGTISSFAVQFVCEGSVGAVFMAGALAFGVAPTTPHQGYYNYESDGLISGFGNDNYLTYLGDLSATPLNQPIVGMAQTADGGGYWLVASDGGIFAYGDAGFYGSAGNIALNLPIVGMAATPDGKGYWLVASDGGIFAYGDAAFYGSMGGSHLNRPIVGMAASPAGGYWLVASDGGIFAFGNAPFYGSTGNISLNRPVVGMTVTPNGLGYWFVASDGGIFAYGDAGFHGSTGNISLNQPIVGMATNSSGSGYWLTAVDGGIFGFNVPYYGSLPGAGISVSDVVGISV
jgi:hypothetical protein